MIITNTGVFEDQVCIFLRQPLNMGVKVIRLDQNARIATFTTDAPDAKGDEEEVE